MHQIQFHQIMRDAQVAHAIQSVIAKHQLTVEATTAALVQCGIPRAANVAQIAMGGKGNSPSDSVYHLASAL